MPIQNVRMKETLSKSVGERERAPNKIINPQKWFAGKVHWFIEIINAKFNIAIQ